MCGQVGVTKPNTPEFRLTLQTYSDYIPPTYGIDPSTGKAVLTNAGYTEVEKWVNVGIESQPFVHYNNSAGQLISLYYDVRWKGTHDSSWQSIPTTDPYRYDEDPGDPQSIGGTISIGFNGFKSPVNVDLRLLDPTATQIDFQVEALIGYYNTDNAFVGQASGWSNTQTLNISDGSATTNPSTSPNSTLTPQQSNTGSVVLFGLDWEQIAIIILGVIVAVLAFALRFHAKKA